MNITNITLNEFYDNYKDLIYTPDTAFWTRYNHNYYFNSVVRNTIGNSIIKDINKYDIYALYTLLLERRISRKTVYGLYAFLTKIFKIIEKETGLASPVTKTSKYAKELLLGLAN